MLGHWRNQLHFQVHDYNECKISYCDQIKFYEPVLKLGIWPYAPTGATRIDDDDDD